MAPLELEIVVSHDHAEVARYTVAAGEYIIGRSSECSIPIQFGAVSRMHVRLIVGENGEIDLEDLGSANGTELDGQLISGRTAWLPGQTLKVGDVDLQLLAIPASRSLDAYAPTLAPSIFSEAATPMTPMTPVTPTPITALGSVDSFASEGDIIRRHLPLVSRAAQRLEPGREIARGGMGAVLSARESATRRTVAMKVMLRGDDAKGTLRFIEEAQVTAQLEHPNIVPVYDLSVDPVGQPFYTMKLVSGITLKKVLELIKEGRPETVKKYPLGTLLTAFQKICDALAFAHSKGVIHRDLKPANIMLGKFGEVLVMDWGLAKILGRAGTTGNGVAHQEDEMTVAGARGEEQDVFATMAGSVMGTPHYMSPEQARGENDTLDQRSDVFTLGVILYEILTLERPYSGRNANEILSKIIEGSFVAPSQRVSALLPGSAKASAPGNGAALKKGKAAGLPHLPGGRVPASLDAIVRKAMALDPAQRYRSVPELQSDLTAYQNGFATNAEGVTAWKQFRFFVARNRRVVTAIGGGLLLLAVSSAAFTVRVIRERERAEAGEAAAKKQTAVAEMNTEAAQLVNLAQSDPEDALIRGMKAVEKSRALLGSVSPAVQFGLTSALERHRYVGALQAGVGDGRLLILNDASGRVVKFGDHNQCAVLDALTGELIKRIPKLGTVDPVCAAMSDDGGMIVVAGEGPQIACWIEGSGQQSDSIREWKAHEVALRAMAFEPGTRNLVTIDAAGDVRTWKGPESPGAAHWKVKIPGGRIGRVVIGADARTLVIIPPGALASDAYAVRLGAPGTPPVVTPLRGHSARIHALAVSADGTKVATADTDGLARVWTPDGQVVGGPFPVQRGIVNALAFSPSGDQLAAAGEEQNVGVYSLHGTLLHGPFTIKQSAKEGIAISSEGVLHGSSDIFDIRGMESSPHLAMDRPIEDIAIAPDESKLAAMSVAGGLQIWDLETREVLAREQVFDGRGSVLTATPDGRLIACTSENGNEVRFVGWDGREKAKPLKLGTDERVRAMNSFPATGWIAVATSHGRLIFHDPAGRAPDEVRSYAPSGARDVTADIAANPGGLIVRFMVNAAYVGGDKNQGRFVQFTNERKEILNVASTVLAWVDRYPWRTLALIERNTRALLASQRETSLWPLTPQAATSGQDLTSRAPGLIRSLSMVTDEVFALGTDKGTLRLYNLSGEPLTPWLRRDQRSITGVIPLRSRQQVVTADGDGKVRFWENGVDRWMQSAARRLSNLERVRLPKTEEDRSVAELVSRYRGTVEKRAEQLVKRSATEPSAKVVASKMPEGWKEIPGTSVAWRIPQGWTEVPQDKIAMINRLAAALFSQTRTAEFDIVAGLIPKGADLKSILADGRAPGIQVLRINSGSTPADVARLAKEGMRLIQRAVASGRAVDLMPGQNMNGEALRTIVSEWNEKFQSVMWTIQGESPEGDRTLLRAIFLPTSERSYIIAMRAGGAQIESTTAMAEELFAGLYVPERLRVDDAFRSALRTEIVASAEQSAKAETMRLISARSEEFGRKRSQAYGLIDAGKLEEGRKLAEEAIQAAEYLEKADPAKAGKWMLECAQTLRLLYSKIHTKGKGATALDFAQKGLEKAEGAHKALSSVESEMAVGEAHHRLGDSLRMLNRVDESAAEYARAVEILKKPVDGQINSERAIYGIEAALKWSGMEWYARKNATAAEIALDHAVSLQKQVVSSHGYVRDLVRVMLEGSDIVERIFVIRGAEPLKKYLAETFAALDEQRTHEGLDRDTLTMLAKTAARLQRALDRKPEIAALGAKQAADRTLFWLARLEKARPLTDEEATWRKTAEKVAAP